MYRKRIIVCLDVRDGKTTKGIKFKGNVDIGDPVQMAKEYYQGGVDELVFYDITASSEGRGIMIDVVERVAQQIFIPFSVGGGISSPSDMRACLLAGAEKISVNSQAVKFPGIIEEGAGLFGRQCIVLGMDALKDAEMPSGYRVVINGGRTPTDLDALEWALTAERLGAGEIVLNSIDADGTRDGYETRPDQNDLHGRQYSRGRLRRCREAGASGGGLYKRGCRCRPDRLHGSLRRLFCPSDQGVSAGPGRIGQNGLVGLFWIFVQT